jgi:MFS transporter, DHA2 family, multidrug resistance protein
MHGSLSGSPSQAPAFFECSLNTQAARHGPNEIFWLSAVILVLIIPVATANLTACDLSGV